MSRSYKKNHYCQIVGMKRQTRSKIKKMSNRMLRRKMKSGLLDDDLSKHSSFKKITDNEYTYDLFSLRAPISTEDEIKSEWYQKCYVRK